MTQYFTYLSFVGTVWAYSIFLGFFGGGREKQIWVYIRNIGNNADHRQVVETKFVGEHGPRQQVGDLQRESGAISIARTDEISDFVVNTDAEASVDAVRVEQPTHADQHQVQVVDGRALNDPVHPARHELNTKRKTVIWYDLQSAVSS